MKRRGQIPRWRRPAAERLDQLLALPMLVLTGKGLQPLTLVRSLSCRTMAYVHCQPANVWGRPRFPLSLRVYLPIEHA